MFDILYHGTSQNKSDCILAEGFLGSELKIFTDGFTHITNGVTFMTERLDEALEYGDTIIEIHLEGINVYPFDDGNSLHYYALANDINTQSWLSIRTE